MYMEKHLHVHVHCTYTNMTKVTTFVYRPYVFLIVRVEGVSGGPGSVIITDVTYSTENKCVQVEEEGEGEGEYVRLQGVIKEKQKELKHLDFKDAALDQEKDLLNNFASHVTEVSKKEVSVLGHCVSQSYKHF